MRPAAKLHLTVLVFLLVTLTFLIVSQFSQFQVASASQSTVAAKPQLRRLVDEHPLTAKLPLSKVLALDYGHDSNAYDVFDDILRSRLRHRQFGDIEAFADELRKSKAVFFGGRWRLARVYDKLAEPAQGLEVSDEEWATHLNLLAEWMQNYPDSITAPVAYAEAWVDYAFEARGDKSAREVSERQWDTFYERLAKTHDIIGKAYKLPSRCPHFYAVMQRIALAESWDRRYYDALFDEAVAFEPLYSNYYSLKANYLLPRWHGNEGDWQQFLVDATGRLGSENGPAMFYYAFKYLSDQTVEFTYEASDFPSILKPLWPRVSRGFTEMSRIHGVTNSAVNQYAKWSRLMGDREEARKAFALIGERWDRNIWKSREDFDSAKLWASG